MRTTYATSIPPGITSATRGQLKLRIDRVVLDQDSLEPIVGNADGAARRICETPYLSFHFWGGEDKPSPVIQPSSLTTRTGPCCVVFPIKTARAQCEAYFKHMSVAKSGLEIRVLMHDIKTSNHHHHHNSGGQQQQQQQHHQVTQAETASATLGRALIRLDDILSNHNNNAMTTSGWFSIVTLPEDSNGFSNIAKSSVLGRMKLSISIEFSADQDQQKQHASARKTSPSSARGNGNNATNNNNPRSRSSSAGNKGRSNDANRLQEKLLHVNNHNHDNDERFDDLDLDAGAGEENNNNIDKGLIVIGRAINLQRPDTALSPQEQEVLDQKKKSSSQRSASANSTSATKPPLPKVIANNNNNKPSSSSTAANNSSNTTNEDANKLLAAGLKLRQQLSAASKHGNTPGDIEAMTKIQNSLNENYSLHGEDPYSRLTLNQPPHDEEEIGYHNLSKKNRKHLKKFDKYAGYGEDDEDDDDDDDSEQHEETAEDLLLAAGYPTDRIARLLLGREQQPQKQQQRYQPQPAIATHSATTHYFDATHQQQQQQQQNQNNNDHHYGFTTILPANRQQMIYPSSSSSATQQQSTNSLAGQFVVRVCVGQLALQSPCSAVKLVCRFSPDVLFTVPPELGCFVSPEVELPIADDDVVGFNVTGIRRLTQNSRVVVELYAKLKKAGQQQQDDDDFTLLGLSMAPISSTAATGVLKNVVLRNPLSAGSVAAQCDLYLSFFQEVAGNEIIQYQQQQTAPVTLSTMNTETQNHQHQTATTTTNQQQQQNVEPDEIANNVNQQQKKSTSRESSQPSAGSTSQHSNQQQLQQQLQLQRRNSNSTGNALIVDSTNNDNNNHAVLCFEVLEAKNIKPVVVAVVNSNGSNDQNNNNLNLVVPPTTFAMIDDVTLFHHPQQHQSAVGHNNNNNNSNNLSSSSTNDLEFPANDWETLGPDASCVFIDTSIPQYRLSTEIAINEYRVVSRLAHVRVSIHHCRNKEVAERFVKRTQDEVSEQRQQEALYLDPERNPEILELIQSSVELGVAEIPVHENLLKRLPFDGWVHVYSTTSENNNIGDSVGQIRVRCHFKK